MSQFKQIILVTAILFASLMTSVAFSYAITPAPSPEPVVEKSVLNISLGKHKHVRFNMNQALPLTIPKVND